MICPECNGLGLIYMEAIHGSPRSELICPTCEGRGELPDRLPDNYCLACGEPIPVGEQWCSFHQAAHKLSSEH